MLAARQLFEDNFMQLCTGQFLLAIRLGYVSRRFTLAYIGDVIVPVSFKSEKRLLMCGISQSF